MQDWTFKNYVSPSGRNAIADWINAQPAGTSTRLRSALNTTLLALASHKVLERPQVGQLHGDCSGLFEIVLRVDKIQYRPIGCYGPGDRVFTLLAGAIEKGNRLIPTDVCETAKTRRDLTLQGENICDHCFD